LTLFGSDTQNLGRGDGVPNRLTRREYVARERARLARIGVVIEANRAAKLAASEHRRKLGLAASFGARQERTSELPSATLSKLVRPPDEQP
jgi:hypothetical protein